MTEKCGFKPYRVLSLLKKTDFLHAIALTLSYQRRVQAKNRGVLLEKLPTMASTRQEALWLVFEDYQRWAEPVTQAFEIGARFLHNQGIFAADDLPYPTLLVVLVCLITALGERVHLDWIRAKLIPICFDFATDETSKYKTYDFRCVAGI